MDMPNTTHPFLGLLRDPWIRREVAPATSMKCNRAGVLVGMMTMERWGRAAPSCQFCRSKKLKCERSQPCSNCTLRKVGCDYGGVDLPPPQDDRGIYSDDRDAPNDHSRSTTGRRGALAPLPESPYCLGVGADYPSSDAKEILQRIRRLESAVFDKVEEGSGRSLQHDTTPPRSDPLSSKPLAPEVAESSYSPFTASWTSFCSRSLTVPPQIRSADIPRVLSRYLPNKEQAALLLDYFAKSLQPTFGVLPIPSTRGLVEQTYADMLIGKESNSGVILLLFAICAACALTWTSELLGSLKVTSTDAKVAFRNYRDLFITLLDSLSPPLVPSTIALEALLLVTHLLSNTDSRLDRVYALRARALWMTRELQIHRLDTTKSRERRKNEGCDQIEIEVQRRKWWYMVASDWLSAFSGGPLEGTYVYHPAQMKVEYPLNLDDEDITTDGDLCDAPLSVPTSMSYFLHRIRLAQLCREAVDTLPPIALESQATKYDAVLALHAKFQDFAQELPVYFRLNAASIQQSQSLSRDRPYIAWQRAQLHFSFHTRLCRLHRPFHLEGLTDPTYSFSRQTCTRSAQTVLELRRPLDDTGSAAGLRPALYCLITQQVFLAAVILATDVSFDPESPQASTRKAQVLAACDMLEAAKRESALAREYIESNIRKLRSLLKNANKPQPQAAGTNALTSVTMRPGVLTDMPGDDAATAPVAPPVGPSHVSTYDNCITAGDSPAGLGLSQSLHPLRPDQGAPPTVDDGIDSHRDSAGGDNMVAIDNGYMGWDQVWTDFFEAAPELDLPQWNILFNGIDSGLGPTY
ncbi:hypothetical protein PG984_007362 [Apiospora sp. TS-2023a]